MAFTPSQRPTREWPLLLVALVLVGTICGPLWYSSLNLVPGDSPGSGAVRRARQLLLGPEQVACYCCFTWACFILLSRYLEVLRQRRALSLGLLPTDEGVRILPEDGRPMMRKVDQLTKRRGPYILANMVRLALGKYAVTRSSHDVSESVRTQAEVDLGRLVASMSTVHYLAWAIPAIGFLGTVRGLSASLAMANQIDEQTFIAQVSKHLTVAFDCTLVALALSLVVMFLLHSVQRDEEAMVIDCKQYCLEHLVNRLYDLEPVREAV